MSFMFNPSPYDEPSAINRPKLSEGTIQSLIIGMHGITEHLVNAVKEKEGFVLAIDGYPSADLKSLVNTCGGYLKQSGIDCEIINVADYYSDPETLEIKFSSNLPKDKEKDPVLLFGKRLDGGYEELFDKICYLQLLEKISVLKKERNAVILYGFGCTFSEELQKLIDKIVYLDIAPKEAVLRAKKGKMINIGDKIARPFKELMRRAYYIDFEIALHLRRKLLQNGKIDYYIDSTSEYKMLTKHAMNEIFNSLSSMPFRCKPVYIEGVWGGQYVKRLRNVPDSVKNIAWVFDFIPMEVSVLVEVGNSMVEFPFYTFLNKEETSIMGDVCSKKFGGYFPIRFNYDDTFHSSGNMSVQVHSGEAYNRENFNEFGRQDESYYVISAGHGAKTYLGFCDDANPKEFIEKAKESEKKHTTIDYQKYINAVESKPGTQVMIPAGTVHASGRNQLILEIGSLTVGSYTYKLYDYLRLDLDGIPRPIHMYHGENVLCCERNASWINENVVQSQRIVRQGENWKESILGEHELLYFSLRHLEFETEIEDNTNGKFHVLSLVDGESVIVESIDNPELCYKQKYLDIIVIPASMGRYRIRNLCNNSVIIHKTMLKDAFQDA